MELFFYLMMFHFLADFGLQATWLAQYKSRDQMPAEFAGHKSYWFWLHCLIAHSGINALFVALVTGNWLFGVAELILHALIDFGKCEHKYGVHTDQALHVLCKIGYCLIWFR